VRKEYDILLIALAPRAGALQKNGVSLGGGCGGLCGLGPGLAEEAADGVRGLGALGDPVIEAIDGELGVAASLAGIVHADLLDEFAVAGAALICDYDPVIRGVFRAFAAESDGNHIY
jgi:hypothetical protein